MEARNNNLLNKQRKKSKKKPRKTKKNGNLKALKGAFKCMNPLFSQFCKSDVIEGQGRLRAKGKQGVEGMFFKRICSEYVTRDHLNEANEAKKNEDINRIIDLGEVFLHKRQRLGSDNRTPEISPGFFRNVSDDSNEDIKQLSPISFGFTLEESCDEDSNCKKIKSRKLDLEKEFAAFVSKYDETVGAHVLHKLPKNGVLEDAIDALRKIQKIELTDSKKDIENGTDFQDEFEANEFIQEFNFLTENFESEMFAGEDLIDNFDFSDKFLNPKKSLYNYEDFMEKPSENFFFLTDVKSENYNPSSFMPIFDKDGGSENLKVLGFQEKDFEKSAKDLSIVTPPIQYYRRNMF